MSYSEKICVLELLIAILQEHETRLDELITNLEQVEYIIQPKIGVFLYDSFYIIVCNYLDYFLCHNTAPFFLYPPHLALFLLYGETPTPA